MSYRKNISGSDLRAPFLPEPCVTAGEVVEVQDVQDGGSALYWNPEMWQPVDENGDPI
jgi:hypothetical protein